MLDENKTKWNGMECIEQMIGCIAWQLGFFYYFNIATYVMCYLNFNTLVMLLCYEGYVFLLPNRCYEFQFFESITHRIDT
jgi:hypothetical protein